MTVMTSHATQQFLRQYRHTVRPLLSGHHRELFCVYLISYTGSIFMGNIFNLRTVRLINIQGVHAQYNWCESA